MPGYGHGGGAISAPKPPSPHHRITSATGGGLWSSSKNVLENKRYTKEWGSNAPGMRLPADGTASSLGEGRQPRQTMEQFILVYHETRVLTNTGGGVDVVFPGHGPDPWLTCDPQGGVLVVWLSPDEEAIAY